MKCLLIISFRQWKCPAIFLILTHVEVFSELISSGIRIEKDFEMSKITSFRTGGYADYIAFPEQGHPRHSCRRSYKLSRLG